MSRVSRRISPLHLCDSYYSFRQANNNQSCHRFSFARNTNILNIVEVSTRDLSKWLLLINLITKPGVPGIVRTHVNVFVSHCVAVGIVPFWDEVYCSLALIYRHIAGWCTLDVKVEVTGKQNHIRTFILIISITILKRTTCARILDHISSVC